MSLSPMPESALPVRPDDLVELLENPGVGDGSGHAGTIHVLDLDTTEPSELDALVRHARRLDDTPGLRPPLVVATSTRPLPDTVAPLLELLTFTLAPSAPGRAWVDRPPTALDAVVRQTALSPTAATTLDRLLRATADLPASTAVEAESAAYQVLLGSAEFERWLAERGPATPAPDVDDAVRIERHDDVLEVTLHRPERRNAFGRCLRDALVEALDLLRLDPSLERAHLRGAGPSFSAGGDLAEFGTSGDPGATHLLRVARHPGLALDRVRGRVHAHLHGACVGAGIEVPAFAGHVTLTDDAWFQLPELSMGLVPGAGGTVSIPRRIGRWRTAWMVLSAERITATEALAWGLADARE